MVAQLMKSLPPRAAEQAAVVDFLHSFIVGDHREDHVGKSGNVLQFLGCLAA